MKRRTILKRVGVAGLGIATIGAGATAADAADREVRRIELDGETYLVFGDADPDEMTANDVCTCEYCNPTLCDYCGPCP